MCMEKQRKIHQIRVGILNDDYVIGIAPPIDRKIQANISKLILDNSFVGEQDLDAVTVFSEQQHNEWTIKDITEAQVKLITFQIKQECSDGDVILSNLDNNIYSINNKSLFDEE